MSLERLLERFIFFSRWLLAPFFVLLIFCLVGLLFKAAQEMINLAMHLLETTGSGVVLETLSIVDLTLTGSLIIIVVFSGYSNFVSKIEFSDHPDWPSWMSRIDFSGQKLKLMASIVAISGVQVLRNFMEMKDVSDRDLTWSVVIHMVLVISALLLAASDRLSSEDKET